MHFKICRMREMDNTCGRAMRDTACSGFRGHLNLMRMEGAKWNFFREGIVMGCFVLGFIPRLFLVVMRENVPKP